MQNVRTQGWVSPLFSPDSDDRLSLNFHRFVILCDTRSVGFWTILFTESVQWLLTEKVYQPKFEVYIAVTGAGAPLNVCLAKKCVKQFFFLLKLGPNLFCLRQSISSVIFNPRTHSTTLLTLRAGCFAENKLN